MEKLKLFIKYFFYITAGVLLITAVSFSLSDAQALPKNTLWQVLCSSALTAGVTALFTPQNCRTIGEFAARGLIHYAALCVVMIVCGHSFGWVEYTVSGIAAMMVSVALVYLFTSVAYYIIDCRDADEINRKLREKYKK